MTHPKTSSSLMCSAVGLLVLQILLTIPQVTGQTLSAGCQPAANCTACLQQGSHCTWCYLPAINDNLRCDTISNHQSRSCGGHLTDPHAAEVSVKDEDVRNADSTRDAVLISPQKMKITLPPGRSTTFPITFRIAENYPVDLYYIMDLSASMRDDQTILVERVEQIVEALQTITTDVRLGFGAFVDKPVMPYAGTREESIQNPCFPDDDDDCAPTYGFRNFLSLTTNTSVLKEKIRQAPISGNQDAAEGGFDALVQAMVCQSDIGWRENSRKIVLLSTDAQPKIAADGKIAGILKPNDGHCHMKDNEYSYSTIQDFPSIGQISDIAKKTSTSIIFAVHNLLDYYKEITNVIESAGVGDLARNSDNIVALIEDQYNSLIKQVKLQVTSLPGALDGVDVRFWSNCSGSEVEQTNVCKEAKIGQRILFEAELSLTSCTESSSRLFQIKPSDLADNIEVELEIECDCDCGDKEMNSERCSGQGTYSCGICTCNPGFTGISCECDDDTKAKNTCVHPYSNQTCSNNGECSGCGSCMCNCVGAEEPNCVTYTGKYCQCDPRACDNHGGLLCGGRGECTCIGDSAYSQCICMEGYTGPSCQCTTSKETCRANNGTGEVCNGKGTCECGQCVCSDPCYTGPTCENLATECSRTCVDFRNCVDCVLNDLAHDQTNCPSSCPEVTLVTELSEQRKRCSFATKEDCSSHYTLEYKHSTKEWIVEALEKCQKEYWLELIIGLVVGVLLIGIIALIIWKVAVTIHDRREFAKFEKERQNPKWESTDNPIYKPATSTFRNPMYGDKQ